MKITLHELRLLLQAFEDKMGANSDPALNKVEEDLYEKLENFLGENHIEPEYVEITLGWFSG
jgi:hypothetical protein